uniref:FAD-binding FR-type domain-containing protein n=1 Tax=Chromera velia CCMP2878 TaxID=1169474 RepID=A0A0G4IAV7_9ALVE|eukprot:Cvel_2153.t1-p1 / transcript=Cvel_2153.t1 / gene=Cvel_2153 / organism=Chromera_velia_CCMP2878 / gene_product=Putative respiratory burst oxidase homolog protein, putative / transcript_product=Putative respiratory burst oxidase homolog protein, putative / location=Cvel_scaffold83:119363-125720(-) / protein_length=877 / sequence_SO=supercontig / SO=protein_coding / is_pseudo=false
MFGFGRRSDATSAGGTSPSKQAAFLDGKNDNTPGRGSVFSQGVDIAQAPDEWPEQEEWKDDEAAEYNAADMDEGAVEETEIDATKAREQITDFARGKAKEAGGAGHQSKEDIARTLKLCAQALMLDIKQPTIEAMAYAMHKNQTSKKRMAEKANTWQKMKRTSAAANPLQQMQDGQPGVKGLAVTLQRNRTQLQIVHKNVRQTPATLFVPSRWEARTFRAQEVGEEAQSPTNAGAPVEPEVMGSPSAATVASMERETQKKKAEKPAVAPAGGKVKKESCWKKFRTKYKTWMPSKITIWAFIFAFIVCGAGFTGYLFKPGFYAATGYGGCVARGSATTVMVFTGAAFFFMCRGLLTALRNSSFIARNEWAHHLLDHHRQVHMSVSYVVVFFGLMHAAAHLLGSYMVISSLEDVEVGRVGLMFLTAMPTIRTKKFEAFIYTHHIYIVIIGLFVLHGRFGNFSNGIPQAPFFIGPFALWYILENLWRLFKAYALSDATIRYASVAASGNVGFFRISKPKHKTSGYKAGQIVFVNCPEVSALQWHPFSLCSSPGSQDLRLMIGKAGDWTGALLGQIQQVNDKAFLGSEEPLYPRLYIDGPFGAPADFSVSFPCCIFVGAGTGMAPFLGFLNHTLSTGTTKWELESKRHITKVDVTSPEAKRVSLLHPNRIRVRGPTRDFARGEVQMRDEEAGIDSGEATVALQDGVHTDWRPKRQLFVWINRGVDEIFWMLDSLVRMLLLEKRPPCEFQLHITTKREEIPAEQEIFLWALEALQDEAESMRGGRGSVMAPERGSGAFLPIGTADGKGEKTPPPLLSINFGRPNFEEVLKTTRNWEAAYEEEGVGVYICAGQRIVGGVKEAVKGMRANRERGKFFLVTEDFG